MGSCLSKKTSSLPLNATTAASQSVDHLKVEKKKFSLSHKEEEQQEQEEVKFRKEVEDQSLVKKEIFVIKHRKSQDTDKRSPPPPPLNSNPTPLLVNKKNVPPAMEPAAAAAGVAATAAEMGVNNISSNANGMVKTSSCTKEEVDAILIQCGILSRSNSGGAAKAASSSSAGASGRKYSGSKRRSFDFDHNGACAADVQCKDDEDNQGDAVAEERQHRQRHHHRRHSPSSSQGRRRTPSRERDQNSTSSGRRLSRSPAKKRSETTTTTPNSNNPAADNRPRPAKMLSVPAASLAMDKSNNAVETQTQTASAVKRISVKRCSSPVPVNVGEAAVAAVAGSRTAASPRSRSPARSIAKGCHDNNQQQQQQQPSLSRSSSRKAEQSPYRRNPLTEIDQNCIPNSQPAASKATCVINSSSRAQPKTKEIDVQVAVKESVSFPDQKPNMEVNIRNFTQANGKGCNLGQLNNPEGQQQNVEKANGQTPLTGNVVTATVIPSGIEGLNPQALTRSRSARRSRDLDLDPETLLNPTPSSYTALLLEDIQNFHQKKAAPSFSVPPCVTKACSILEAVADLNSTTNSNLSSAFSNDRRSIIPAVAAAAAAAKSEAREPFLESEILARDDLTEPSFHKYVTVRRGGTLYGDDMDGQESSGSNSFVDGSQQHWGVSASSWEPNSADSTDRWSSRLNTREVDDDRSPLGFQKHPLSGPSPDMEEARRKGFSGPRSGIGRGRLGTAKNLHATPVVAATAST